MVGKLNTKVKRPAYDSALKRDFPGCSIIFSTITGFINQFLGMGKLRHFVIIVWLCWRWKKNKEQNEYCRFADFESCIFYDGLLSVLYKKCDPCMIDTLMTHYGTCLKLIPSNMLILSSVIINKCSLLEIIHAKLLFGFLCIIFTLEIMSLCNKRYWTCDIGMNLAVLFYHDGLYSVDVF